MESQMYKIIRKVEDNESVVANHVLNKETAKQLLMNDVYNHIENRGCLVCLMVVVCQRILYSMTSL